MFFHFGRTAISKDISMMFNILRATIATTAILIGTAGSAQTATDTMTFTMDGSEIALLASPTFARAQSRREISSAADYIDEINVIGYLLQDNAIDMQVRLDFTVWNLPDGRRIESPNIQITERGDEGGWTTINNGEGVVLDLTTYERSDAGLFVEGTFSGNPDYWPVIYKKPQERGPTKEVSGRFSIFFPIE